MKTAKEKDKRPQKVGFTCVSPWTAYAHTLQVAEIWRPIVESHQIPYHEWPYWPATHNRATWAPDLLISSFGIPFLCQRYSTTIQNWKKFSGTSVGSTLRDVSCSHRTLTFTMTFLHRQMRTGVNSTLMRSREIGIPTTPNQIFVLTNIPGRVFLELCRKPRVFDNVWNVNETLIFKSKCLTFRFFFYLDVFPGGCGRLEGEDVVRASIQRCLGSWCDLEHLASEPWIAKVRPNQSSHKCVLVEKWTHKLRQALLSQNNPNFKLRITECTHPILIISTG